MGSKESVDIKKTAAMDSEQKKPQIYEKAMLLEIEEAEQQEINENDQVEQEMREMEEEESGQSGEDDDVDRLGLGA
jgi:hypothetical protein